MRAVHAIWGDGGRELTGHSAWRSTGTLSTSTGRICCKGTFYISRDLRTFKRKKVRDTGQVGDENLKTLAKCRQRTGFIDM